MENDCIKVVVRVRPETEAEAHSSLSKNIVRVVDTKLLIFDPVEELEDFYYKGQRQNRRDLLKKSNKNLNLMYDYVFDSYATNDDLFCQTTKNLIPELLKGYNCSVFAYGATGAGKTYTMLGSETTSGIVFLTMLELYKLIENAPEKKCDITISYLEIYNETIRDLINPSKNLILREDSTRGPQVVGLSFHKPNGPEDLLDMLIKGNKNRTQHPTDANAESSRSHAVFQVYVKIQDKNAGINSNAQLAKLSLIDLAGSERASVAKGHGARLREGANINKSLLALASCINALAENKTKGQYVPYRNSKLTHLLKDSLGGNCRTIMIAAVSPSSLQFEDTYNTLKYADRARSIQLTLKKNVVSINAHLSSYSKIVEDLKKEIATLKSKNKTLENKVEESQKANALLQKRGDSKQEVAMKRISDRIPDSEKSEWEIRYQSLRKQLLDCESKLKHIELKINWRLQCHKRVSNLTSDTEKLNKSACKTDAAYKNLKSSESALHAQKSSLESEIESMMTEPLPKRFKLHQLSSDVEELKIQSKHLINVALTQECQAEKCEKMLETSLSFIRRQQLILQGHGFLTQDLKSDYDKLIKQVEGAKEVVWADQADQANSFLSPILRLPLNNPPSLKRRSGGKRSLVQVFDEEAPAKTPTTLRSSPRLLMRKSNQNLNSTFSFSDSNANSNCNTTFSFSAPAPLNGSGDKTKDPRLPISFAQALKSPAPKRQCLQPTPTQRGTKYNPVSKIHRPYYTGPSGKPLGKEITTKGGGTPFKNKRKSYPAKENKFPNPRQTTNRANSKKQQSQHFKFH